MKGSLGKLPVWLMAMAAAVLLAFALQNGQSSSATQQERRIAQVLSAIAGAGKVEVALYYAEQANSAFSAQMAEVPTGALVVAEGADDMSVRLELIRAMRTLLGLPENAVDVFVMEGDL